MSCGNILPCEVSLTGGQETRAGDTFNFNVFLFNLAISQHGAGAL